jgi:hypothetical protein
MEQSEFAESYERYWAQCIRAGVEPLTPDAMQARSAEWQSLGLRWDTEPQKMESDVNLRRDR